MDVACTHLEVHSHFTLLGGTASVAQLADRAAADGLSHLALTDTNALYGVVAFTRACRGKGVQPVIGMTVTVSAPQSASRLPQEKETGAASPERAGHLVLLATGPDGYRSLCRLSSLIQGHPNREILARRGLSWDDLAAHREGLICLSGGRRGWIERRLRSGDVAGAQAYAGRLAGIYDDYACLTLEIHTAEDYTIASEIAALGQRLGLPTVAVAPVYCLNPDEVSRLHLLAAIRENRPLAAPEDAAEAFSDTEVDAGVVLDRAANPARSRTPVAAETVRAASPPAWRGSRPDGDVELHWLSPEQMASRFASFPEAVTRSGEIASRCGAALPDGKPIWPALKLSAGESPDQALAHLAATGLRLRCAPEHGDRRPAPADTAPELEESRQVPSTGGQRTDASSATPSLPLSATERLSLELAAIAAHGYAPLFLVVADAVRFARARGIPVSTRGSVANSLVAYCTGITTVDPIQHGLLFERFLNPARTNPPDIDLDFCSRRRDEVLHYLRDVYGPEHVALVCTVSTMRPQSAVRETGKAYGLDEEEIGRIVSLLPRHWHPDPRRRDRRTMEDVLGELPDPRLREIVRVAYSLVGQPDHLSVHPGGVIITPGALTDVVPVQWAPKGFLVTQFEHGDVEAIGLPKIDMLGIRALTVLSDAAQMAQAIEPGFSLDSIPLDDPLTAELLEHGDTIGVFQCESDGAQRTLRKLRARSVRDLAVANAFFKPGPAMGGMADAFVRRYRGQEPVRYLHPALEPILRDTKGVLIFQEQVLRVAREVAGLTWAEADQLRRGMGHFGADEMAALQERFETGCRRAPPAGPGFTPSQTATLWEQVMSFAGYGFNQGHATAYADVSYRSAYLKAHWPAQFLCARLADYGGFHHPAVYMAEAIRLGLAVMPPHVNFSGEAFTLTTGVPLKSGGRSALAPLASSPAAVLWMGLGQVRDLRRSAIEALVAARAQRPFRSLSDLLQRVELQAREIIHLIQCGGFEGLGESRFSLLKEAEAMRRFTGRGRARSGALQMTLPFEDDVAAATASDAPVSEGAPLAAASLGQYWAWETQLLGLPVSALATPLALVAGRLPDHLPLRKAHEQPGRSLVVAGVRLPGWTGGQGFFLSDGSTFVIAKGGKALRAPQPWRPLLIRGRWAGDGWGSFWLQIDQMTEIAPDLQGGV